METKLKLREVLLGGGEATSTSNTFSCPDLLEGKPKPPSNYNTPASGNIKPKSMPKKKKYNSTSVFETAALIPIVISTVEAEDISSLEYKSGMLGRNRKYRSASLDRVS